MKTNRMAVWASLLSLALAGCASHKEEKAQTWGGTVIGQLHTRAVVQKVDPTTREITVKHDTGETTTAVAGPLVRNFDQIKPGDRVALQYQEAVTILAMSGVEAAPARVESVDVTRAPLGQKPAGMVVERSEAIAEVVAINRRERTVTLRGPLRTLEVQVDKDVTGFDRLKPGDKVYLRVTATLAGAVTAE